MSILEKIIEHKRMEIAALDAPALRRAVESVSCAAGFSFRYLPSLS